MSPKETYTQRLASVIAREKFSDVPEKAVVSIKRAILDDIGNAFMGYYLTGKRLVDWAKEVGGKDSTIIGDGTKVECGTAASVNAQMAIESMGQESGPNYHMFSSIGQTGIAMAELLGSTGKDLITAVALGYDVNGHFFRNTRLKTEFGTSWDRRATVVPPAVCAAKLLGLNELQMNYVIGLGLHFYYPSTAFLTRLIPHGIFVRFGAQGHLFTTRLGIQMAQLVEKGVKGARDVLDVYVENGIDAYDLEAVVDLKSPKPYYYVTDELCLKLWHVSWDQVGGIEKVIQIMKENGLKPKDIKEVRVGLRGQKAKAVEWFGNQAPKDFIEAVFSLPWQYGTVILDYRDGIEGSDDIERLTCERLKDKDTQDMVKKVTIFHYTTADKYPEGAGGNDVPQRVEVVAHGKTYIKEGSAFKSIGHPNYPLSREQLEGKMQRNSRRVIGIEQANEIIEMVNNLEELDNVTELAKLFSNPKLKVEPHTQECT